MECNNYDGIETNVRKEYKTSSETFIILTLGRSAKVIVKNTTESIHLSIKVK
jgi:hypothetical protein